MFKMVRGYIELFNNSDLKKIRERKSEFFDTLIGKIKLYLDLDVLRIPSVISFTNEKYEKNDIFSLGVNRRIYKDQFKLEISKKIGHFLPIIMLREAFYCFIPEMLLNNSLVKIFINQIIENDFEEFDFIKNWKKKVRNEIINFEFLRGEFDRLDKYVDLKKTTQIENPIKIFFRYMRDNFGTLNKSSFEIREDLMKESINDFFKTLRDDDLIETIRILIKIFYEVKTYRSLHEYNKYFQELKEIGIIETDLSLNKFRNNVKWINESSYIAPTYDILWNNINVGVISCILKFNPNLNKSHIDKIIEGLPFFIYSRSSANNFSIEVIGFFVFPVVYLDDIKRIIQNLENFGYIEKKNCLLIQGAENYLNLNYFREFYKDGRILDPVNRDYEEKYEISFQKESESNYINQKISFLEFLILDRVRYWSITGFSFERRPETLKKLKSDLFNELLVQQKFITNLRMILTKIDQKPVLSKELIYFIDNNRKRGFFFLKKFLELINLAKEIILDFFSSNEEISNVFQFVEILKQNGISRELENNFILSDKMIRKLFIRRFLPLYFENRNLFAEEMDKYSLFSDLFNACSNLKIFNLNMIKKLITDQTQVDRLFTIKELKLKKLRDRYKLYEIKSSDIDDIIDSFLNRKNPIIKPFMISTINTTHFSKYFLLIILKGTNHSEIIEPTIKKYFPRVLVNTGNDLYTNVPLTFIYIYLPNIVSEEKRLLFSVIFNLFSNDLILVKRFFNDGFMEAYSRKEFYDFNKSEFFYTPDLFEQYFLYIRNIIKKEYKKKASKFKTAKSQGQFWGKEEEFQILENSVKKRIFFNKDDYDIGDLKKLIIFGSNLKDIVLNIEKFKKQRGERFFDKFIDAIKFKPNLSSFGLDKYHLYFRTSDWNLIDGRLLLSNTFKKVRYPAIIDDEISLYIEYLFPLNNPNRAYINWILKSKKILSEFFIFRVKNIYQNLHIDYNLGKYGWNLDPNNFKNHIQNILFGKQYKSISSRILLYSENLQKESYLGPESEEFQELTEIYGYNSVDLKSVLGTNNTSLIQKIQDLCDKDLIIPYVGIKNIGLKEKISIFLFDLKPDQKEKIINIFCFFNLTYLYEIQGSYFLQGNIEQKEFEDGLYIKLYLPDIEISSFQRIFYMLFEFLEISKYMIFYDMVNGDHLVKSIIGNDINLENYNPTINLEWNTLDKKWMNPKLFEENFEPNYPDLFVNQADYKKKKK